MSGQTNEVQLLVGTHTFNVRCTSSQEKEQMIAAAQTVDAELKTLRVSSEVADGERAAIMAALKITAGKPLAVAGEESCNKINKALDKGINALESVFTERRGNC